MVKNSISERIKVTKGGKLIRRLMSQGHFRARKSGKLIQRKRNLQLVSIKDLKRIKRYLS